MTPNLVHLQRETMLGIALLLVLGTFIVAATLLDWAIVGIGATALLMLAILIEMPYLYLFVEEAERDERAKVSHEPSPIEGSEVTAKERSTASR